MPASSNAPPSPPAATHTGTMLRGAAAGGSFSGCRRIFRQDRALGHVPGQRGDRVDDPVADLVVHSASRCPGGANQPVDDLVRRQLRILRPHQSRHTGHDRGGETGPGRHQQGVVRTVNRVDQTVISRREPDDVGTRCRDRHPRPGHAHLVHRCAGGIHRADSQDVVAEPRRSHHRGHAVPVARIVGVQRINERVLFAVALTGVARGGDDDRILVDRRVTDRGTQVGLVDEAARTHAHHLGDVDHLRAHVGGVHDRPRHGEDVVRLLPGLRILVAGVGVLEAERLAGLADRDQVDVRGDAAVGVARRRSAVGPAAAAAAGRG